MLVLLGWVPFYLSWIAVHICMHVTDFNECGSSSTLVIVIVIVGPNLDRVRLQINRVVPEQLEARFIMGST